MDIFVLVIYFIIVDYSTIKKGSYFITDIFKDLQLNLKILKDYVYKKPEKTHVVRVLQKGIKLFKSKTLIFGFVVDVRVL